MDYPKYVITELCGESGVYVKVHLMPLIGSHTDVGPLPDDVEIVGAGFFSIGVQGGEPTVFCFGKSTTLNVVSRRETDAFYLRQFLGLPR